MPETFNPINMTNESGTAIDADYFNHLESGIQAIDSRVAQLERGVDSLVTVTYASSITPNAAAGSLFRCVATGNLTVNDPINGDDGQKVTVAILASGANRTISFAGNSAAAITIPSGTWWVGELHYHAASTNWVLRD